MLRAPGADTWQSSGDSDWFATRWTFWKLKNILCQFDFFVREAICSFSDEILESCYPRRHKTQAKYFLSGFSQKEVFFAEECSVASPANRPSSPSELDVRYLGESGLHWSLWLRCHLTRLSEGMSEASASREGSLGLSNSCEAFSVEDSRHRPTLSVSGVGPSWSVCRVLGVAEAKLLLSVDPK